MQFDRQKVNSSKLPSQVVAKWSEPILEEGFVPFAKKFLRTLTRVMGDTPEMQELAVLLAVIDFRRPNPTRLPSAEFLAFLAGLDQRTFDAALKRLQDKGYVAIAPDFEGLAISINGLLQKVATESKEETAQKA